MLALINSCKRVMNLGEEFGEDVLNVAYKGEQDQIYLDLIKDIRSVNRLIQKSGQGWVLKT